MSLLPYFLNDTLDDFYTPRRLFRPTTALDVFPAYQEEINRLSGLLNNLQRKAEQNLGQITNQDGLFKVNVDVQQFKPEEINVKVVDDYLLIEAKHEERKDKHGYISRQFTRRYKLPEGTNFDAIKSNVSSDGVLTIVAPTKVESIEGTVRQIPITFVNEPAIKRQTEEKVENSTENK